MRTAAASILISAAVSFAAYAVPLFSGDSLDGLNVAIDGREPGDDPQAVFAVEDELLRISGEEPGVLSTPAEFANYRLVAEWKWGERTWPPRAENARESGILLHMSESGAIECRIGEGTTGDIVVHGGEVNRYRLAARAAGAVPMYRPGGEPVTLTEGAVHWWGRDPGWEDRRDFRGAYDAESPGGEWNLLECVVRGDRLRVILNGVVVNEAFALTPAQGRIGIRSGGAEIHFRRFDVTPLDGEATPPPPGRFIYNSDANNMFLYQDPPITPEDVYPYVDELADTQITTLFMSPNNGMVMNFPSKVSGMVGEGRYDEMPPPAETEPASAERTSWLFKSLVDAGHDPLGLVLDRAKSHGLETFISFRMNEVHATEEADSLILSRFWKDHPEYHIGKPGDPLAPPYKQILGPRTHPIVGTWLPGGLNFAVPEVRAYRLAQLREVLERYDVDGLDLDFQRFPMYFKPGEEEAGRAIMTAFVREIRALTREIADARGRPVLLSARILAAPQQNAAIGLDPETWAAEGLIDFVIVSHYLRNDFTLPIQSWRARLPEGMAVYASVEYEPEAWAYRHLARGLYEEGVDGLMLFNFFARREAGRKEPFTFLYKELGRPETILGPLPLHPLPDFAKRTAPVLLVVNKHEDSMSYVDPDTLEELYRVPTGHDPHEMVITPDQRYAYISNYAPPGDSVTVIDLYGGRQARLIPTGRYTRIHSAAISPDGKFTYFTAGQTGYVVEVDTQSNEVVRGIPTEGRISHMVMVSPDGEKLYTANIVSQNVSVIDRASGALITQITCGAGSEGLMFTPDGKELWVANQNAGTITVIDVATHTVVDTFPAPGMPLRIRFTKDGSRALVTSWVEQGELIVIDVRERREIARIPVGNQPIGVELSPDESRAFVTSMTSSEVHVIDMARLEVVDRIVLGAGVDAMAWWHPGGAPAE